MFAFSACGEDSESDANDPLPAELRGTWERTAAGGVYQSYTFDDDLVSYYEENPPSVDYPKSSYDLTKSLIFNKMDNKNATTMGEYPSGYFIEGKITSATGLYHLGHYFETSLFLSSGKDKFSEQGYSFSIFTKKP